MNDPLYIEFTGLPASGKSELIAKLSAVLADMGMLMATREDLIIGSKVLRYVTSFRVALFNLRLLYLILRYCLCARPVQVFNIYLALQTLKFALSFREMEMKQAPVLAYEGLVHWLSAVAPERLEQDEQVAQALFQTLYPAKATILFVSVDTPVQTSVERYFARQSIHPRFRAMDRARFQAFSTARVHKESRLLAVAGRSREHQAITVSGTENAEIAIRAIVEKIQMIKNAEQEQGRATLLQQMGHAAAEAHEYSTKYIGSGSWHRLRRLCKYPLAYGVFAFARTFGIRGRRVARLFFGSRLSVPLNDGDAFLLARFGILVGDEYKLIKYFIKNLQDEDIFYDIGANYGFYSALAARIITRGQVHVFEPIPEIFSHLSRSFAGCGNCTLNQIALSDRDGVIPMYSAFSFGTSAVSTIDVTVSELDTTTHWESISVTCQTLDGYAATHAPPTIIKLDVEGAERFVLGGGRNTILNQRPIIAMEIWGGEKGNSFSHEAASILLGAGYRAYEIDASGDLVPFDDEYFSNLVSTPEGSQNFIFKPR